MNSLDEHLGIEKSGTWRSHLRSENPKQGYLVQLCILHKKSHLGYRWLFL